MALYSHIKLTVQTQFLEKKGFVALKRYPNIYVPEAHSLKRLRHPLKILLSAA